MRRIRLRNRKRRAAPTDVYDQVIRIDLRRQPRRRRCSGGATGAAGGLTFLQGSGRYRVGPGSPGPGQTIVEIGLQATDMLSFSKPSTPLSSPCPSAMQIWVKRPPFAWSNRAHNITMVTFEGSYGSTSRFQQQAHGIPPAVADIPGIRSRLAKPAAGVCVNQGSSTHHINPGSKAGARRTDLSSAIANYRADMIDAFADLLGGVLQYLRTASAITCSLTVRPVTKTISFI